jgi:flagellar basal-body rod protein FlgB
LPQPHILQCDICCRAWFGTGLAFRELAKVRFAGVMDNKLSNFLFDQTGVPGFQKYLDLSSFRHKLVAGNIANVATPGFRSQDIDFQAEYEKATKTGNHLAGMLTDQAHIPLGRAESRTPEVQKANVTGADMNSVDIDAEISNLAQNELRFTIAAKLLQIKFSGLKKAITSK